MDSCIPSTRKKCVLTSFSVFLHNYISRPYPGIDEGIPIWVSAVKEISTIFS